MMPLLTLGLFVVLELICSNIVEPWIYGSSTGVSSFALILAAVFWTWLWGPIGLMLATPLAVCLVVMGRHVPRFAFLSVLLSDEEPLTPAEDFFHRLLAVGLNEASELADTYVKANSLTALYDTVLIPVITAAETDHQRGALDNEQLDSVEQGVRDIVEDSEPTRLPESSLLDGKTGAQSQAPLWRVCCLPARAYRDEIAGAMLVHLLHQQGIEAQSAPAKLLADELVKKVDEADVDAACISVVAPSTVIHARYLCVKLRAQLPNLKIAVGLWGASQNIIQATQRLRDSVVNAAPPPSPRPSCNCPSLRIPPKKTESSLPSRAKTDYESVSGGAMKQKNSIRLRKLKIASKRVHPEIGVIAESVLNRTVSGIEERGAQLPQGRNLLFERFGRPDVAAAEADVFQTERSDVGRVTCRAAFPWARRPARAASIGIVPRSRSVTGSGAACCAQRAARHTGPGSTSTFYRDIQARTCLGP